LRKQVRASYFLLIYRLCINFDTRWGCATFWAIFSKTHLVALGVTQKTVDSFLVTLNFGRRKVTTVLTKALHSIAEPNSKIALTRIIVMSQRWVIGKNMLQIVYNALI
jgi:hypothetical protein